MYLFTIVPFLYFLKTRLKGKVQRVSWVFVYFIPSFILFNYFAPLVEFKNIVLLIISITLINYIYENGYLQNDIKTTKKEKNPTLRLSLEEMQKVDKNWNKIVFLRVVVSLVLIALFYFVSDDISLTLGLFIISLSLQILYLIYNSIRNICNLILILPINYIRFYGFIISFVSIVELPYFVIFSLFLYPVSKFLEFTNQPRYNLQKIANIVGNVDTFRIKYYLSITIVSLLVFIQTNSYIYFLIVSIYYLLYRLGTYYMINQSKIVQDELLNNIKKEYRK